MRIIKKLGLTLAIVATIGLTACTGDSNNTKNLTDMLKGTIPEKTDIMPVELYDKYLNDIKIARENIAKKEDEFNSYMTLANAYMNFGEKEKALSGYDKATQIGPGSGAAWMNKGAIYEEMGDYKEALKMYEHVINEVGIIPQAFLRAGVIMNQHIKSSDKEIREFYDNSVIVSMYHPQVAEMYIKYLYYDAKDEAAALKVLDEAIVQNPTNQGFKDMKTNGLKESL